VRGRKKGIVMNTQDVNPALRDLSSLVGEWVADITFPGPDVVTATATVSIEWIERGAFIAIRSTVEWEGPGESISVIGRNDENGDYTVLYFDDRGVSRIYQMIFKDGVWRQWRDAPGFSQRFTGELSESGDEITAMWEASEDGETWTKDFDLDYRRART
jgi:hypothetical protein